MTARICAFRADFLCGLAIPESSQQMHRAWIPWSIALVLPVFVGACAGVPRDASLPINDPNEETNRKIFAANQAVLHPASQFVKAVTPGPITM